MKKGISFIFAVIVLVSSCVSLLFGNGQVYADGNLISDAVEVSFGKTYYHTWTRDTDHRNYYMKISLPSDGKINIEASKPYDYEEYGSLNFAIYKSDGRTKVYDNNCYWAKSDASQYYSFDVGLYAGDYYMTVLPGFYVRSGIIETEIKIKYSNSEYYEKEPNNSLSTATLMEDDMFYRGYIGEYDMLSEDDYYSFNLTKGRCYRIYIGEYNNLEPSTVLVDFLGPNGESLRLRRFKDSKGKEDFFSNINNRADASGNYFEFICSASGRYAVKVYNYSGSLGELTYKIKCKDMAPKVTIDLNTSDMDLGCKKSKTLKATITNTDSKPTWTSSDPSVATVDNNGKVTGKSLGNAIITASVAGKKASCNVQVLYNDVMNKSSFWYEPTYALTEQGVVKGYDNQSAFKPGNECTRAQMVTFLWRLNGEPKPQSSKNPFPDVKKGDYYYKAVLWAVGQGITTGYSDGKFKPQNVCTRAQTVTFMWRMAGEPEPRATKSKFKDVKESDYYFKATLWASEKKIVAGYKDGTFKPKGKCLRRQMVTFLYKYKENVFF